MKIGNIIASIGIVTGVIGMMMLPFYNFTEMPFLAGSGYAKGGGWLLLTQSGIFKWPGLVLAVTGGVIYCGAKMLPRKYWKTAEDLFEEEIEAGKRTQNNTTDRNRLKRD
jgi:hypothetical protein